ncbi:MAG: hypothetical protein RLY87_1055 [Chloroflexota bacterium]|jgi:hypothetical protein
MELRRLRIILNVVGLVFVSIALFIQYVQGAVTVLAWASLVIALIAMLGGRFLREKMRKEQ